MIAPVVASESARAQTQLVTASWGLKDYEIETEDDLNCMGKQATEGDSPVRGINRER